MANVVITTSGKRITINFGIHPVATIHYNRSEVKGVEEDVDQCVFMMNHRHDYPLSFDAQDNAYIVDSINSVAPTSQADLVAKLIALIDY